MLCQAVNGAFADTSRGALHRPREKRSEHCRFAWCTDAMLVVMRTCLGVRLGEVCGVSRAVVRGALIGVCCGALMCVPCGVIVGVSLGVLRGVLLGVLIGVFIGVIVGVLAVVALTDFADDVFDLLLRCNIECVGLRVLPVF